MILVAIDLIVLSIFFSILNVFKKNKINIYFSIFLALLCFFDLGVYIIRLFLSLQFFYINIFIYEKLISTFLLLVFIYFNFKESWRIIALFVILFSLFFLIHSEIFEFSQIIIATNIYNKNFPHILLFYHYIFASIAQTLFLSSFILSFFFFYERWRVKHKRFGPFIKLLPSLPELDKKILTFISLGFGFLTVSIFLGFLILKEIYNGFYLIDPNNVFNVVLWLMFLIYIIVRKKTRVMTEKLSLLVLISTILTFLSIFLSYFTITFHNFR
ncbi:cytochrome c assembly protein [Thermodesulfobium narugense DSM 14796]|uniref:Cytochrome c assembly protein n=1 Tax=Thermodesulfobium narugense DSM 14796 TaxID=747365 RepID=M1E619_9BACT|nr:cytochrome c biogenesis protein CcsA [Thermodesulfobium narugense]AEE14601.1 cytochrome c assembly protein [Thermodesulfobium narugense DSM 14796]